MNTYSQRKMAIVILLSLHLDVAMPMKKVHVKESKRYKFALDL